MLRPLYDWTLDKASHRHAQWWLAALAFADGAMFPFPPHPLMGLMCLAEPKKAVRFALITTLASVAGGVIGYFIGHFLYHSVGTELLALLGLTAKFPVAACYLNRYGAEIIMVKGLTPVPFILITITAGFISFPLPLFVGASLVSRGGVFMTIGLLFRMFGPPIKAFLDKYLGWIAAGLLALVVSGYLAVSLLGHHGPAKADPCASATPVAAVR